MVASVGAGAAARRVEFPRRGERAGKIAWNASRTFLVKRRQVLPRPLRARPQHALHAIATRQEDGSRHPSRRSPVRAASSPNALDWSFPSSTRARVRVPFATTRRDADASPAPRRSKSFDPLTRTMEPGPRARTARSSRVCEAPRFARFLLKLANGKLTTRGLMIGASDSSFPGSQSPSRYLRHAQCAGWRASTVEE